MNTIREREERILAAISARRAKRDPNKLYDASLTLGQRVADGVATTMGSWHFIIVQSVLLAIWLALNITELIFHAWDPYPFILLNLALSFQAAYAAPIIMMSQNRQSAKDRLQAEQDLNTRCSSRSSTPAWTSCSCRNGLICCRSRSARSRCCNVSFNGSKTLKRGN
jgi:uncharacterized membrane protein